MERVATVMITAMATITITARVTATITARGKPRIPARNRLSTMIGLGKCPKLAHNSCHCLQWQLESRVAIVQGSEGIGDCH